jgi:hypothetical protein
MQSMLTLIHGDDTNASRNYYLSLREKASEKKIIDGNTITLTDLMQIFSGNGLFGDQETICIEELLSKRKPSRELDEIISFLQSSIVNNQSSIFIWESKQLTPKQVGLFGKATVNEFKIPTVVFTFLDSIRPNNTRQMLQQYHQILEHEESMYVLVMLIRQIRILLALSQESNSTISEVSRMAPWQKSKLQKQADLFEVTQLMQLHSHLFDLEYGQKTGALSSSLSDAIDFFLASI